MGRFHVGAAEDDDDDPPSSSSPAAAANNGTSSNVEAMELDVTHDSSTKANGAGDDSGNGNTNQELEMLASPREPWEDRCYDDANVTVRHTPSKSGRSDPVSTPPPPPEDDGGGGAVVPYDGSSHHSEAYALDPDQAAAEELAAQLDRDYDSSRRRRRHSFSHENHHRPEYEEYDGHHDDDKDREEDEEEERERQARIDTRIRMLWGGRDQWERRRRGEANGDGDGDEDDERRVGGHVLGGGGAGGYVYSGGGSGDAPPYSANIYGHGHGYGYYQGGQQYNDNGSGGMMAPYNGNGPPHAFHHTQNSDNSYPDTFQPSSLFQRLRHSRPIVRYSIIILAGLVLSYLCRRAPPPPPPHYDWTSYIVQSTHSILGEVERVSHDTVYILGGFVRNVYQDAIDLKDAMAFGGDGDGTGGGGGRCVLRIPTFPMDESSTAGGMLGTSEDATSSYIEQRLRADIFGQDRAIRIISRALEAWEGPSNPDSSEVQGECALRNDDGDDNSETCKAPAVSPPSQEGGRPLTLLLSGPEGTGKSETSRLLARLVFPDCPGHPGMVAHEYDSSSGLQNHHATMPRGVLFIDGRSYSDGDGQTPEGYAHHQRTRALSDRIVGHIQRQRGAGAVIVISQIENLSPSIAVELVRLIKSSSSADTNSNDFGGRAVVGEKGARWNNVLFLFTSYLGADKLFQLIHTYEGTEYISDRDLTSTVRSEIDDHFGSSTGLGNSINTVAAFMPLGVEQMEDILDRKVRELSQKHEGSLWKRLDVTERALSYFAGPDYMEYLSLQNRETGSTVFSFSKRGAHTLEDGALLQTLRSVRRHISARPDEIAVFDYDANEEEATMRWCTDGESDQSSMRRSSLSSYKCGDVAWKGAIT